MTRSRDALPDGARPRIRRRRALSALPGDRRGRRHLLLLAVFGVVFALIAAQLLRVQILEGDVYAAVGAAQRDRVIELPARRGRIYDREGAVLATSVDAATVYADPRAFKPQPTPNGPVVAEDPDRAARLLAPLLDREPEAIRAELTGDGHFAYLARQIPWETGQKVLDLGLDGIGVLTEATRTYPGGDLAAHLLGFTDIDGRGLEGLELAYDGLLSGTDGELLVARSPSGLAITSGVREVSQPVPGTDLVLAIDREIQAFAEATLKRTVEEYHATGGSIVVLDVGTGDVLAMANAPTYDPDRVGRSEPAERRNRAVTDVYEPGSVQKALTAAAAIEAGVVDPSTVLTVPDHYRVGPKVFSDSHHHPTKQMTFAEIIKVSSNVGTIKVAQRLGAERLYEALRDFGYGQPTGLKFPGESGGILRPPDGWWTTSLPTIAIGQGVAVTLLQVANAYATIANDGVAVTPRLVRGTVGEDGRLDPAAAGTQRRIISTETAEAVQQMLAGVVSEEGTGTRAAVPGYEVAGKTGTAQKPRSDGTGYSGEFVAHFVGFAPADDPRIVVGVMIDEPSPIWGGVVAAPAFAEVMEFTLMHRGIAPAAGG